jgi:hypothetical protein
MIRRRSFLIGCGGIVASPAFAHIAPPSTTACAVSPSAPIADTSCTQGVTLRVDGWDSGLDSGADAWVHINSSWRATWR